MCIIAESRMFWKRLIGCQFSLIIGPWKYEKLNERYEKFLENYKEKLNDFSAEATTIFVLFLFWDPAIVAGCHPRNKDLEIF